MKLSCPICKKSSEFEDTGVGWKCPNCTGHVFSEYVDGNGKKHRYSDYDIQQSNLANQTHVFDLDATDIMTGNRIAHNTSMHVKPPNNPTSYHSIEP